MRPPRIHLHANWRQYTNISNGINNTFLSMFWDYLNFYIYKAPNYYIHAWIKNSVNQDFHVLVLFTYLQYNTMIMLIHIHAINV